MKQFATVENKEQLTKTNIYILVESINNEYRYIVKCFKDGQKVDEQLLDNDEDALRFSLEFCQ
jgi:hypothetical protein